MPARRPAPTLIVVFHHQRNHGSLLVAHHESNDALDRPPGIARRGSGNNLVSLVSPQRKSPTDSAFASLESINRSLQEENEALQAQLNQAQLECRALESSLRYFASNADASDDPAASAELTRLLSPDAQRPPPAAGSPTEEGGVAQGSAARTLLRRGKHGLHHHSAALSGGDDDERAAKLESERFGSNDTPEPAADDFAEEKDDATTERIRRFLQKRAPFDTLDEAQLLRLVGAMVGQAAAEGEVIMREGEAGGALCYLVDGGEFAISVGGAQVDSVGEGAVIGELALLYNVPRTATVSCVSEGGASLWVLHRSVFQRTIRAETIARRRQVYEFLKSNHFFSSMGERQLSRLTDAVEVVHFEAKVEIMREGDAADAMYIIKEGQCVVSQEIITQDDGGAEKSDSRLCGIVGVGEYFGERALITSEPRSATVAAVGDVETLKIDRGVFLQLLGPLHAPLLKKMPRDGSPRGSRASSRRGSAKGAAALGLYGTPPTDVSPPSQRALADAVARAVGGGGSAGGSSGASRSDSPGPLAHLGRLDSPMALRDGAAASSPLSRAVAAEEKSRRYRPSLDQLVVVRPLGSGGFGRVSLVKDPRTRCRYALKIVSKKKLLASKPQTRTKWIMREKHDGGARNSGAILAQFCNDGPIL